MSSSVQILLQSDLSKHSSTQLQWANLWFFHIVELQFPVVMLVQCRFWHFLYRCHTLENTSNYLIQWMYLHKDSCTSVSSSIDGFLFRFGAHFAWIWGRQNISWSPKETPSLNIFRLSTPISDAFFCNKYLSSRITPVKSIRNRIFLIKLLLGVRENNIIILLK